MQQHRKSTISLPEEASCQTVSVNPAVRDAPTRHRTHAPLWTALISGSWVGKEAFTPRFVYFHSADFFL